METYKEDKERSQKHRDCDFCPSWDEHNRAECLLANGQHRRLRFRSIFQDNTVAVRSHPFSSSTFAIPWWPSHKTMYSGLPH